jgi:hypothetical protein
MNETICACLSFGASVSQTDKPGQRDLEREICTQIGEEFPRCNYPLDVSQRREADQQSEEEASRDLMAHVHTMHFVVMVACLASEYAGTFIEAFRQQIFHRMELYIQVAAAIRLGVPVQGVCLYPIVNHPAWINNRHCHNGIMPMKMSIARFFDPLQTR